MKKKIISLTIFSALSFFVFESNAQGVSPPTPRPTPAPIAIGRGVGSGTGSGAGYSYEPEDDSKLTGATIRGRAVYEDTGRPIRYVAIGFVSTTSENSYSFSSQTKFVKTDENGEFLLRNVKEGSYFPLIKLDGILNPSSYLHLFGQARKPPELENIFEKFEFAGLGEFNIVVRAKRGGSISGRITYSDGEVATGVRVEALLKNQSKFTSAYSRGYAPANFGVGSVQTDDRGFYRFSGLPEGRYIIRVIEPVSHTNNKLEAYQTNYYGQDSKLLRTYYPEGEKASNAREIGISLAEEQPEINISLPERKLFKISGRVVFKETKIPIEDFSISYRKIEEADTLLGDGYAGSPVESDYGKKYSGGDWNFRSLPKGKYLLTISQQYRYQRPGEESKDKISYPSISKEIEIIDADLSGILIEVPSEASLSGLIINEDGKPLPKNISLFAASDDRKIFRSMDMARNDPKPDPGKALPFRIGKLSAGKIRIMAYAQDYYIKSIKIGGKELADGLIDIEDGEEIKNVAVTISDQLGSIKGKLEGEIPKERSFVIIFKAGSNIDEAGPSSRRGAIGADGSFEIKAPPGEFSIVVIVPSFAPKDDSEIRDWFKNKLKDAPKLTVKAGEVTNIKISAPKD